MTLSEAEQEAHRARFRQHWQDTVPFNAFTRMRIEQWDFEGVVCFVPLRDELTAHPGMLHGGVIAALIDTCSTGAVMAGHDYNLGSRLNTVSLSVQYLSAAPGEDIRVVGRCLRRGKAVHFAESQVLSADSGKLLATGQVAVSVTGRHPILRPD